MTTQKCCILCQCDTSGTITTIAHGLEDEVNESEDVNVKFIKSFYSGIRISGVGGGNGDIDHYHDPQLSVCEVCRPVLTTALERKQVLDKMDDDVRKLQMELLKELNKLKGLVHQFYDDMKGIEERIGSRRRGRNEGALGSNYVEFFERRIRKVVKDLSLCQIDRFQIPETTLKPHSPPRSPSSSNQSPESQESDDDSSHPHPSNEDSRINQSVHELSTGRATDCDYSAKKPKRSKSNSTAAPTIASRNSTIRKPDVNSIHSHYHPCKTFVINKVLDRKERILSGKPLPKQHGGKTDVPDPRDAYYIDYDPTTDSFSIDGVSITLTITSQNTFNFNCSQCSFLTGQKKNAKKGPFLEILDHVLRLHRKIFQCAHCPRILSDLTMYREHVRGHLLKYVCDICGKPLQTGRILKEHKWLHLNEEEKQQAIREGAKDPKSLRNKVTGSEVFECSTCGKGFNRKGNLKLHQRTHQDKEEKRKVCDKCGKSCYCYASWLEHWKYCKSGGDVNFQKIIQCTKCTNTFKNVNGLKIHLRRNHPEEGKGKGVRCEVCGKDFWTMGELKGHQMSHGDDRPFECGKGCGMRFKTRNTWRHHNKCCDGSGTRPGPKLGKRKKKI